MGKVILQFICLIIFCLSICSTAAAQADYVGGEITYTPSGSNYLVTLTVNTRCTGSGLPNTQTLDIDGFGGGLVCSLLGSSSLMVTKQSEQNISPLCSGGSVACGGSSIDSITQTIYTGILDPSVGLLASILGNCPRTRISYSDLGRDNSSGTIVNNQGFFLEATMNNAVPVNSTPTFEINSLMYVTRNGHGPTNLVQYSHGAFDADGDSLVYSLVNCQGLNGAPLAYLAGYSGTNPMSGTHNININPNTGQISFLPQTNQQSTLCVQVDEYRGATVVGTTIRNIEVIIKNGPPNHNPVILPNARFAGPARRGRICASGIYQFNLQGTDADNAQIVDANIYNLPTGATFTKTPSGNTIQLTINWAPTTAQVGLHEFTVEIFDDNCDLKGINTYNYSIRVLPSIRTGAATDDVSCVGNSTGTATIFPFNGVPPYTYNWSSGQSTANIINLPAGNYQVTATDNRACNSVRSLTVNEPFVNGVIYSEERVATVVQGNWTFPNLANSSNNVYAGANTTDTDEIWSNFQFTRANTDDIVGIEVSIEGNDNASGAGVAVDLFHPTSGTFSNMGYNVTFNSNVDQSITFGSPADRWGYNWNSIADINQAGPTGFQVRLTKIGAGVVEIDEIRVKVYYVDNTPYTFVVDSVALGSTVTLAGDRMLMGGTFSSPNASVDNGIVGNVLDASGIAAGTYTIEYTGSDDAGCPATEVAQMRVFPPFDCSVIKSNSPVCEGDNIRIEDTLRVHTPGVTSWQIREPGSGAFSPTTIFEHNVPNSDAAINSGVYIVRVNAGGTFDCRVFVEVVQPQANASSTALNFAASANGFWTNTNGARLNDGNNAISTPGSLSQMQLNTFSSPGFGIPANAVILGIEVEVEAAKAGASDGDLQIRLRSGASPFSRTQRRRYTSATPSIDTYGTPNFLWGRNWTAAQINSGFVVELSTPASNLSPIEVDYAAVKVYYNIPSEVGIPNLTTYTQPNVIDLVASGPPVPSGGVYSSQLAPAAIGGTFFDTRQVAGGVYDLNYGFTDSNGCVDTSTILLRVQPGINCGNITANTTLCTNNVLVLEDRLPTSNTMWQWEKPLGNTLANTRTYTIPNTRLVDSGTYHLIVSDGNTTDTCTVEVDVNAPIGKEDSTVYLNASQIQLNNGWINAAGVQNAGLGHANSTNNGNTLLLRGFNATPVANRELLGIQVKVLGRSPGAVATVSVDLSADGGTTFSPVQENPNFPPGATPTGPFTERTLGSDRELWGFSSTYWQTNLATNVGNNFVLRLTDNTTTVGNLNIDHVQVKFYYRDSVDYTLPTTTYFDGDIEDLNTIPVNPAGGSFQSTTLSNLSGGIMTLTSADIGTHVLTYGFVDRNGCFGGRNQTITVLARPSLTCSGVIGSGSYCVGDTIVITDTGNPSGFVQQLDLIDPSTNLVTTSTDTFVDFIATASSQSGTYILTISDTNATPNLQNCLVNININTPPPATIYALEDSVCQRDRLRLFTDANPNYVYTWESPTGVIYKVDTVRIGTAVLNDGGTYTLNIEDTTTGCSVDTFINITVSPLPGIPSIDPTTLSVCDGNPINLNLTTPLGSTDTVKWQFNGGAEVINPAGVPSLTINPGNISTYKTGIVRAEVFSEQGCSRPSAPRFVEVKPTPVASISNPPNFVCHGDSAVLQANVVSGATYIWYDDPDTTNVANIIQSGTNPQLILNNLTTTTTVYLVVVANGCRSGVDNHTIAVDAPPYHPNITNNTIIACQGDDIVLETTEPGNSYTWLFPSVGQSNNRVVRLNNVQPTVSGRYILQMTNTVGCPLLDTFIDVTVRPRPNPFNLEIDTICQGDSLILVASGLTLAAGDFIDWYSPDGTLQATTPDTIFAVDPTNVAAYQSGYWEAVAELNGCRSLPERANAVFVQPPVSQGITVNTPVCVGDDVFLSTPSQPNMVYQWFDGRVTTPFATGTSAVILNIAQSDTIYLVMNELPTRKCATVDSIIIEVGVPVSTTITFIDSLCEGDGIAVDIAPAGNSQQWTHATNGFTTANPDFLIVPATLNDSGKYYISYVDTNGCSYEDSISITVSPLTTGIISTASTPICEGTVLELEVTAPINTIVSWEAPDGTIINSNTITALPSTAQYQEGLWTAEIFDINTGCSSFVDTFITIYDRPITPLVTLDTPQCVGTDIQATAGFIPNVNRYNWLDSIGQLIALGQNPVFTGITTDTTIYLDLQMANGCIFRVDTIDIRPRINTIPTSLFSSDTLTVCGDGNIVTFNNVKSNNFAYFWTSPDGSNSIDTMPFATASSFYEGWYYLEIEDTTTTCTREDSVYLAINAATSPSDNVILTSSPCLGQQLSVQYNPTGITTPGVIYEFTFYDSGFNPLAVDTSASTELLIGTAVSYYDTLANLDQVWVTLIDTTINCRGGIAFSAPINLIAAAPPIPNQPNPVCSGDSVLLGVQVETGYSYVWYDDAGLTNVVDSNAFFYAQNITATDTFYVQSTSPQGCLADSFVVVEVITNLQPPVVIGDSACVGDSVIVYTITPGNSFQWTDGGSFTTNDSAFVIAPANLSHSGIYTLTMRDTNGCLLPTVSTVVQVYSNPGVPIIGGARNICDGDTLVLNSLLGRTFDWYDAVLDTLLISNDSLVLTPSDSFYQQGSSDIRVVDTDINGCSEETTITINIQSLTTAGYRGDTIVCEGDDAIIRGTNIFATYTWYESPGATTALATGISYQLDSLLSDTFIYYTAQAPFGCLSDTIAVPIQVNLSPAIPNIGSDTSVCATNTVQLTTNTTAGVINYQWAGPNNFISNQQNPVLNSVDTNDAGSYSLYIIDTNQCASDSAFVLLTVDTLPSAPMTDPVIVLCQRDTLFLVADSTSDCDVVEWVGPTGTSILVGDSIAIPFTDTMNYKGGLWRANCIDTATGCFSQSNGNLVIILSGPDTPQVSIVATPCLGGTVELVVNTPPASYSYTWYADSSLTQIVANGANPTIGGIDQDTIFYVVATDGLSCTSLPTAIAVNPLQLGPPNIGSDIEVCEGSNATLAFNGVGNRYQWTGPNGFNTYDSVFVLSAVSSLDTGIYTFSLIDTNGCQLRDTSLRLTVNPNPTRPIVGGNNMLCDGVDTIVLYTTNQTTLVNSVLEWSNVVGGVVFPSDTFRMNKATGGGLFYTTGDWFVVARDTNTGCTDTSAPYSIQINPIPTTSVVHNTINCGGGTITFQPNLVQSGANYTWYEADSTTQIAIGAQFTINNLTTDTIVVLEIEQNGCLGYATDTINITTNGTAPVLLPAANVCEGEDVTIGTTSFGTSYEWINPSGNFITYDSAFVLNGVSVQDTGNYTLQFVDNTGCTAQPVTVRLDVNPAPNFPVITGDSAVCEGETIVLNVNLSTGDSVRWINSSNISTVPFTTSTFSIDTNTAFFYQTGTIQALVTAAGTGCTAISASYNVTINSIPNTIATNNGPFCGVTNAVFEPAFIQQGANYTWLNLDSVVLSTAAVYSINNLSVDTTLVLVIEQNGCTSADTLVNTFNIPATPVITGATIGCEGQNITFGTNTYGLNYEWTGPAGFVTYDSILTITNLGSQDTGTYQLRFVDSVGCQAPNSTISISMLPAPPIPNILGTTTLCEGDTIELTNNVNSNYNTVWVSGNSTIVTDTLRILPSSADYNNTNWTLIATDTATGCTSSKDTVIVKQAAPIALISNNGPICAGADAVFTAANITGASYVWYQSGQLLGMGSNLVINNVNTLTTVTLEVSNTIGCTSTNTDSIEIAQGASNLIVNNDTVAVVAGASSTIVNVIANDSLGGAWNIQVLDPLNQATAINLNNGSFDLDFTGVNTSDEFTYEVCNPACNAACDTAVVFINVELLGDCMIPNIFTPNADNVNDVFEIPCLSGTGNKLWIFNRWGDLIYETDNYLNNWDGTHHGMAVPDGTYFYILQTSSGEERQSSIEVRR